MESGDIKSTAALHLNVTVLRISSNVIFWRSRRLN